MLKENYEDPQLEDYLLSDAQGRPSMYPKRSTEKRQLRRNSRLIII